MNDQPHNDDLDRRLRSYFASIERESLPQRAMPLAPAMSPPRPHPLLRIGLAAAAVVLLVAGVVVVRARHHGAPSSAVDTTSAGVQSLETASSTPDSTPSTFPTGDSEAQNYLVVGADNGSCVDPDSSTSGGFGDRTTLGERSDTIMIVRVAPGTHQVAILSLPRDLWVRIDGSDTSSRINAAFVQNNPQVLINTIYENFGIPVNHYLQIDFCGFKTVVDAIGGVTVPFATPVRDLHTGLDVPVAGCRNLNGDEALAYVRSRHFEYQQADGTWAHDPAADLGRIGRQQDFLFRALVAAMDHGLADPGTASELISAALDDVVTDPDFTLDRMLELVGVMRQVEPGSIANARIETQGGVIAGQSVLVPTLDTPTMRAVLAFFRGEQSVPATTTPSASSGDGAPAVDFTSLPSTPPAGVVPDPGATC